MSRERGRETAEMSGGWVAHARQGLWEKIDGAYRSTWKPGVGHTPVMAYDGKGKKLSVFINQQPKFGWNSYVQVLTNVQVPNALISSFVVTIPATIIPIMIAAFAAYAFACFRLQVHVLLRKIYLWRV